MYVDESQLCTSKYYKTTRRKGQWNVGVTTLIKVEGQASHNIIASGDLHLKRVFASASKHPPPKKKIIAIK